MKIRAIDCFEVEWALDSLMGFKEGDECCRECLAKGRLLQAKFEKLGKIEKPETPSVEREVNLSPRDEELLDEAIEWALFDLKERMELLHNIKKQLKSDD